MWKHQTQLRILNRIQEGWYRLRLSSRPRCWRCNCFRWSWIKQSKRTSCYCFFLTRWCSCWKRSCRCCLRKSIKKSRCYGWSSRISQRINCLTLIKCFPLKEQRCPRLNANPPQVFNEISWKPRFQRNFLSFNENVLRRRYLSWLITRWWRSFYHWWFECSRKFFCLCWISCWRWKT